MAIRTYLQGSFTATLAATVRFTHDDSGDVSDWTLAEGDHFASADELIAAANAAIVAGAIGVGGSVVTLSITHDTSAHTGTVAVATDGSAFGITWSQSGDGTEVRDWLGEIGDLAIPTRGYDFTAAHQAGWYPSLAAQRVRLTRAERPRAMMQTLSGATRSQHNAATTDADEMLIDVTLWCDDGSGAQEGLEQLEAFIDELHSASGEPFSIYHGESGSEEQWVCRFQDGDIDISPTRPGRGNQLWAIDLRLIGESAPW